MRSAPYKQVLDRIASYLGEADGLSADDAVLIAPKLNLFVRLAWEFYWWPDLMVIEQRTFRPSWSATTTYAAGTEVYNPADGNYYQSLRAANLNNAPTLNGVENSAWWAASAIEYSADDFDSTTDYAVGAQARNPADGRYYQMFARQAAIQVAGGGAAAANGNYVESGTVAGRPGYYLGDYSITYAGVLGLGWVIADASHNILYGSASDVATPDLATGWFSTDNTGVPNTTNNPVPTVTATDQVADISDANYWGLLTPFVRSIDYQQAGQTELGEVRFIWDKDPQVNRYAQKQRFRLRETFVQVLGTVNVVYVEYRLRPSTYVNTLIDETIPYTAGTQIYDPTTGENWTFNQDALAGYNPTNAPTLFTKVPFPYAFVEYVAQSVYAALTNREEMAASQGGQPESFGIQQTAGYPLLLVEIDKIERQQGQTRQLNVQTGKSSAGGWWYRS
jgi:hypothetical protein